MTEPTNLADWLSLIGAITGPIGAIAGITAIIATIYCLKQIERTNSLNLRMEKARVANKIQVAIDELHQLCDKANQSRIQRYNLQGMGQSRESQKWQEQMSRYKQQADELSFRFNGLKTVFTEHNAARLESDISKLHLVEVQIVSLADRLKICISEDNVARVKLHRTGYGT